MDGDREHANLFRYSFYRLFPSALPRHAYDSGSSDSSSSSDQDMSFSGAGSGFHGRGIPGLLPRRRASHGATRRGSNTDVKDLKSSDLYLELLPQLKNDNTQKVLAGCQVRGPTSRKKRHMLAAKYLPNQASHLCQFETRQYEGKFSRQGNVFSLAGSDGSVRLYNVASCLRHIHNQEKSQVEMPVNAKPMRYISCSLTSPRSVDFSSDDMWMAYSGWSDLIYLCNITGDYEIHEEIPLHEAVVDRGWGFCLFSISFSSDSLHLAGGANDCRVHLVNLERKTQSCIDAHDGENYRNILVFNGTDAKYIQEDVNAVAFLDDGTTAGSNVIISGSDDRTAKIWDLRAGTTAPVTVLRGHTNGLTCVSSRKDGRHIITNGKDDCLKVWDLRKLNAKRDMSLLSFKDHYVSRTLVRCSFSPDETTGSRYVCTGCATGAMVIYDILTGKTVRCLRIHTSVVRDTSWHPSLPLIASTSFDGTVGFWQYVADPSEADALPAIAG